MDVNGATWRKSSRSAGNGGDCVELADLTTTIGVRDSKAPTDGHLAISRRALAHLLSHIKTGKLDL